MMKQILEDTAKANKNLSVVLLRYFNPIGAHESGKSAKTQKVYQIILCLMFLRLLSEKREKLTIFGRDYDTKDGTCTRDYIHVVDLAKGHVKAVEYVFEHKGTEIFQLRHGYSVQQPKKL